MFACLVAACGHSADGGLANAAATSSTAPPSPSDDLYAPPSPLDPARPGTLIWAEQVDGLDLHPPASVWRILYHSRSRDGRDIAVSGFAVVPTAPVKGEARPVYAWAHGTVGLGDQCAPSHDVREHLPPYGGQLVERGAVLVATDYEGLGTPGVPTSTVAPAEGHAVLDSIRAVATLPGVVALGDVVLAGHSQGGRAALFAAEIAPAYAPELHVVGAVALAGGVELPALVEHLLQSPDRGVALIGAIGLRAGYPDLDLSALFTPRAIADVARVETECVDTTVARYRSVGTSDLINHHLGTVPDLQALLEVNSPGAVAPTVPIFLGQGGDDEQVPAALQRRLEARYCSLGVTVTRHEYPGQDHAGVIDAAAEQAVAFVVDRFAGRPATGTC